MKGITIFLVVFGHCLQYGNGQEFLTSGAFFDDVLYKIIYSFHMPLFALVSGYLFFWSVSTRRPREVVMRQANNLVLPACMWPLLIETARAVVHVYRGDFAGISLFISKAAHGMLYSIWFLWAMFFASMVVLLAREKFRDSAKFYMLVIVMLLFVPGRIIPSTYIFVFPYFVVGYIWHREGMDEKFTLSKSLTLEIVLLWLGMLMFFNRDSYVYTTGTKIFVYSQKFFIPSQLGIDVFRWAIGFAGSAAILLLLKLVKPLGIFAKLGIKSLGIYIIHGSVIGRILPSQGGYIINFWEAVIIVGACYLVSEMLSRVKILNKLLLGGR